MLQLVREVVCVRACRTGDSNPAKIKKGIARALLFGALAGMLSSAAAAQNVVTQHGNVARTGANTNETILTTSNVNATSFGKLFSQSVDGQVYAQPLYVANVAISGKGTHNVVFVATQNDSIYAFDADSNGGANASPLWKITLLDAAHGAGSGATAVPNTDLSTPDINPKIGVTGTPTIDTSTNTMYVVGKTKENGSYFVRLHAIDITNGNEKFGGPVAISASVPGNGNGSSGGTLNFDPKWENHRAGLLLLNGFVYTAFAAHGDNGPWHGWIISYNATTLQQAGVWCSAPNGIGSGIWMGGSGLAADSNNPNGTSPGGRLFIATGNGDFTASKPYDNTMDYGDSLVRLELTNGAMKVADIFTPSNQATLNAADLDLAAGGVLVLPDQSTGGHTHLLVQLGKQGKVYLVDRDNMSGFNSTDAMVQSFMLNPSNTNTGLWGMPTYGNNTVYIWGTQDVMKSYPISAGKLPTSPSNSGSNSVGFPSPTATISSSGNSNPIAWSVQTDNYGSSGNAVLRAYDANTLSNTLYSSTTNSARDTVGGSVKFVVPTVANGKVYVGTSSGLAVYGLLNGAQQTAAPVINPAGQSFTGTLNVTITDSTPNASIFYSTTGTATTSSTPYTGTIPVTSTTTISAIASASGFLQSLPVSQTYTLQTQTLMPTFSVIPGTYTSPQTVTITSASPNATIYYAINGPASTSSTPFVGSATVTVNQSETINAIATSPGLTVSPQASATYVIGSATGISFPNGFSTSAGFMTFNGVTKLDDTRLQLTDGGLYEAGSAWYNAPVNIQSFTNTFSFQLSNALADGMTFTIQNAGLNSLGPVGGGLGYGPDTPGGTPGIGKSIAIKFDLYDNAGEGPDSTGLYTNGASPTTPFIDMSATGPDLHSGDAMTANMVYDGTKLTLTLNDGVANKSFQTSWTINIPQVIGSNTAYVGFTGAAGGVSASQKITTWSFTSGGTVPTQPTADPIFSLPGGTYSGTQTVSITDTTPGSVIFYTTDGTNPATSVTGTTKQYSGALNVGSNQTVKAIATASGFSASNIITATYVITAQAAAATPVITPGTGTYTSAQTVSITDSTTGSTIFYALNGPASTTSTKYTGPFVVNSTTTVNAIAIAPNFATSATATATITIQTSGGSTPVNFAGGFTAGGMQFNGRAALNGTRLRLTDTTANNENGSAFFTTPVSITSFTNDFVFQQTAPNADGMTFTIQRAATTALGPTGGGLGYGPPSTNVTGGGIATSVAVKFDLYDNDGEGTNSTGLYVNGAPPTVPATTLGGNVNLHSGDPFHVVMVYDGTTLTMTITDTTNTAQTFTKSWPINIATTIGGSTAFVGFTGGTGGLTATQEVVNWSYSTSTAPPPPQAATPTFSLPAGPYTGTQNVGINDTTAGAAIFYTTDGTNPATSVTGTTKQYSTALTVSSSQTIKAIATASGFSASNIGTATYTINALPPAATPVITPATGNYTSAQAVTITDTTPGASIFYALNGPASTSSTKYTGPFTVSSTTTVNAIATAPNFSTSATATSAITIQTSTGSTPVNFTAGFTGTGMQFNGNAKLNGSRLQLTDSTTAFYEVGSAFYTTPVSVTSFTNDFTFQLGSPNADGFTFTIQRVGPTALGPVGGGLGYGASTQGGPLGLPTSIAVKFDLYDNDGEGTNSTGLYTNGAAPTLPATTMGGNVNLHSGDTFHVLMTYDGTSLKMTITDTLNPAQTFTTSWPIDIANTIGGTTAYVGFTGATGGATATQEIVNWSYSTSATTQPPPNQTPVVYQATALPAASSGPVWRQFAWTGFPDGQGMILDATAVGNSVTLTINVATPGIYDIKTTAKGNTARGIWQLAVNGANFGGQQDEYQASDAGVFLTMDLGNFNFAAAGNYTLKFTVTGKNAASSGYSLCLDTITLTPQ
jgi:hypothetical protein